VGLRRGLGVVALIAGTAVGCARPVVDTGTKPAGVGGTIAGIVRAEGAGTPLSGRKVTAIDVTNGRRYEASTAMNGGYTIKVPVGKYRMEVELRDGESLAEEPGELEISASDLDAGRDFVVRARPAVLGLSVFGL
jgi:hypothetical protein